MLQENIIISLLKDGKTFKLTNEIRIGEIDNGKVFFVLGLFTHPELKILTKEESILKLNELKFFFKSLLTELKDLAIYLKDKKIEYRLSYNYGMGAIGICKEKENEIFWEYNFIKDTI
tara:strand:- start:6823 stop:7176 length:354 start_codon:yes stop_codon:yes gene_type:complete